MSRILISGINGFIGSNLAEALLQKGHDVSGIVRENADLSFIKDLKLKLFRGDITNKASLRIPMNHTDIVIHVAGLASDWGSYKQFHQTNVEGTQNMAQAASVSDVKRFVYISTVAVHGFQNQRFVDENFPMPKTIFPYNETKKKAEKWLFEFARSTQMEVTAIRPGNVFGPNDHTFIEKYLDALGQGKGGYVDGGRHWTCPTYIENLTDGIIKACFASGAVGEAFIITDGLEITWKEFTKKLCSQLNIHPPRLSIPFTAGYALAGLMETAYRLFKISSPPLLTRYRISNGGREYHFSIEKAKKLLNYKPIIPLDEALLRTANWYRKRR